MSLALRLISAMIEGEVVPTGFNPEEYLPTTKTLTVQVEVEGAPTAADLDELALLVGGILWRSP